MATAPPYTVGGAVIDKLVDLGRLSIEGKVYTFQADDLEDLGELGCGQFGTVLKMLHRTSGTEMAVKTIPVHDLRGTKVEVWGTNTHDILELAMVMQSGSCPYIVNFYGCHVKEGEVWICMELMDCSMDKVAKRVYKELKSTIPEEVLGKLTVNVIKALHYLKTELHIIHRDIKPSNILVNKKGEFKLCDFGISGRLVDSIAKTRNVGCRPYMAPERIDRMKAKSQRGFTIQSDVWSFGITLLELAVGKFPYENWFSASMFLQLDAVVNGPPPKLPDDGTFSQEMQEFCVACLIKDMDQRPNYIELQEYEFFKKYDRMEVDVATWYKSVGKPDGDDC